MDDDSFRARVHKVFGALSSSAPSSAWSLTDDEVEKKEWNRSALKQGKEDDDQTLCSSSYDGLFKQNGRRNLTTQGLQNDPNDEESRFEDPNDVWEIRSSIGLDPTLDNEVLYMDFNFLYIDIEGTSTQITNLCPSSSSVRS